MKYSILSTFVLLIFTLFSCDHIASSTIDSYLQEEKYDEAINEFDKIKDYDIRNKAGLKILNKLADKGRFDLAKKIALKIDHYPITQKPLALALEQTVNNLITEKKYDEILLLIEEADPLTPFHLDEAIFDGVKSKVEIVLTKARVPLGVVKKSCTSVDDCIAQYDFVSARAKLGDYFSQSAKTKDLIKIIKSESSYWVGKKQYDKAEEVANEIAGIDPTFFDDSFFGDTENSSKSAVEFADNSIDDVKLSIVESLIKDNKMAEAKKRASLIKDNEKRSKILSKL